MSEDLDSISEEERSLFQPFTRESLAAIEARIAEEHAKQKELEKKRAEGEVSRRYLCWGLPIFNITCVFGFSSDEGAFFLFKISFKLYGIYNC